MDQRRCYLYFQNGAKDYVNNYHGITMINCFEKRFSTILNERLKVWSIENDKSSNAHFVLNKMISAESMEELLVKLKTWKSWRRRVCE